jgi:lysophospholipase L1-like esterase
MIVVVCFLKGVKDMKKFSLCLVAVISVIGTNAFEVPPQLFKPGSVVLFQGDSITHGGRMHDMNHFVGHGYQAEIVMRYLAYRPSDALQFGNRALSGETTQMLVKRWNKDAFPYTASERGYSGEFNTDKTELIPDYLSLLIGVNDSGRNRKDPSKQRVDPVSYKNNLRFMVTNSLAVNPNVKIIICEPFRYPMPKQSNFGEYQKAAKDIAQEYNLVFVPFSKLYSETLDALNPNKKYWCWDSVHPTYAGHMKMADFWIEEVKKGFEAGKGSPMK